MILENVQSFWFYMLQKFAIHVINLAIEVKP